MSGGCCQTGSKHTPPLASVLLLGNPNVGKTTLFNRLCGLRSHTANYPGSTVEARIGRATGGAVDRSVTDLPGVYSLRMRDDLTDCCRDALCGDRPPDAVLVVADATNLRRNLMLVNEVLHQGLPCVVALSMMDRARRRGLKIDCDELSDQLGCAVVPVNPRSGEGLRGLHAAIDHAHCEPRPLPATDEVAAIDAWADGVLGPSVLGGDLNGEDLTTDRLDAVFTHPVSGLLVFAMVMGGLFAAIFMLAAIPMDLIDLFFGGLATWVGDLLPEGEIRNFIVEGIIGGVAGTVVFLPQICLLFFLISLLEDTGYLARASFVMDRVLRRFGLPGQAFVPLLSAHACAIPAIMAARIVPDRRDRLATILVAPFFSCSARLPVYVLLIGLLFVGHPWLAGLAFFGCYVLGAAAALCTSLLLRRSILTGATRPMMLELPAYKWPSIRTAIFTMIDRGWVFLKNAGTVILGIVIVLWWLQAYPKGTPPEEAVALHTAAAEVQDIDPDRGAELRADADRLTNRAQQSGSFAGRVGHFMEPVFRPLGYDWQLSVGVLTSFAAREVFVSTMAVLVAGSDDTDDKSVIRRIGTAKRDDGSPLFTLPTSASLLVFFVLAMQCLPTLAVTRREAGRWSWAVLQFTWMSALAWVAAFVTYTLVAAGTS